MKSATAMVTTYEPTRCGIARFSASLIASLEEQGGGPIDVFRLLQPDDFASGSGARVMMEVNPASSLSVKVARRALQRYRAVVVQHEFGIYGPDDGAAVLDLVDLDAPCIVVLHTVPGHPSARQRAILAGLIQSGTALVVPSESASECLESIVGVTARSVTVIPHGSDWTPCGSSSRVRRALLTWGLLGPGKGIERALRAIAGLDDLNPPVTYRVVGQTHPNVIRREGLSYRHYLEQLASDLGLKDRVEFDDGYKSDSDLYRLVEEADVVVIPYDTTEQICSGVLTDAVAAGKPVVATAFPHSSEMLSSGAGIVVEQEDIEGMTDALRTLLTNDLAYGRAVEQPNRLARRLSWPVVARRYKAVLDQLIDSRTPLELAPTSVT